MLLNRYLTREILSGFLATLSILILIIVGNTLVRLLSKTSNGELPTDILLPLLTTGTLNGAVRLIPVALFIGMMLALGRLYRDNEITALRAAGIGAKEFYRPIISVALILVGIVGFMNFYAGPWLEVQNHALKAQASQRPEAAGIPAGVFLGASTRKGYTVFVEDIANDTVIMRRFFMHIGSEKQSSLLLASEAILFIDSVSGERVLQLKDGHRYDGQPQQSEFSIAHFEESGLRVPLQTQSDIRKQLSRTSTAELFASNDRASIAELHWRLANTLSVIVLALLALPLSHMSPRQGRYSKLAWGIFLYAIYANLLIVAKVLLEKENVPTWLGIWWPHLLMLLVTWWLLKRHFGIQRIRTKLRKKTSSSSKEANRHADS